MSQTVFKYVYFLWSCTTLLPMEVIYQNIRCFTFWQFFYFCKFFKTSAFKIYCNQNIGLIELSYVNLSSSTTWPEFLYHQCCRHLSITLYNITHLSWVSSVTTVKSEICNSYNYITTNRRAMWKNIPINKTSFRASVRQLANFLLLCGCCPGKKDGTIQCFAKFVNFKEKEYCSKLI